MNENLAIPRGVAGRPRKFSRCEITVISWFWLKPEVNRSEIGRRFDTLPQHLGPMVKQFLRENPDFSPTNSREVHVTQLIEEGKSVPEIEAVTGATKAQIFELQNAYQRATTPSESLSESA